MTGGRCWSVLVGTVLFSLVLSGVARGAEDDAADHGRAPSESASAERGLAPAAPADGSLAGGVSIDPSQVPVTTPLLEELFSTPDPLAPMGAFELTPGNMSLLSRSGLASLVRDTLMDRAASGPVPIPQGTSMVSVVADRDNTLFNQASGATEYRSNGAGPHFFAGRTQTEAFPVGALRRGLLHFDVAGALTPPVMIENAVLRLFMSQSNSGNRTVELHTVLADWGEGASDSGEPGGTGAAAEAGDATWDHRFYPTDFWTTPGGDFTFGVVASQTVGGPGFYDFTSPQLVSQVQSWFNNPSSNFGWIVIGNESSLQTAKRFDTRENQEVSQRPTLILTVKEGDTTPPAVNVTSPHGADVIDAEDPTPITWTATDANGIAYVDVFLSLDSGTTYSPVALGLTNTNGLTWYPPQRPTNRAIIKVEATDNFMNTGMGTTGRFIIHALNNGLVDTTLRDFDLPGTQPLEHGLDIRNPTTECAPCHGNFDSNVEPYFNWRGSMMANASRDPLFHACLTIANQDAPASGDLCIRCHVPRGWLAGRSTPTDGSQILDADRAGVSCDFCHRLVDPIYEAPDNPPADEMILASLTNPPSEFGNGMTVVDPNGTRRGPRPGVSPPHAYYVSPYHTEAAFCGNCHDVSNPAYESDGMGHYVPGPLDEAPTDVSPHTMMPIERTYSEWLHSTYNSPSGVYAPEFAGANTTGFVSTCQDCHMRRVSGKSCFFGQDHDDLILHDLTGGSTWLPPLLPMLYPGDVDPAAQAAVVTRAQYMLQNAADIDAEVIGSQLKVTVTNNTGHKLPTGYPEGRRMWLNVKFFDGAGAMIGESGAYNSSNGVLTLDPDIKVYEAELGVDATAAALTGLTEGVTFHFVLNNKIYKDNRIPPRGFTNAGFADFGGTPVGATYADGQYWDDTYYDMPTCAASIEVTLYYQSTSKDYVEFLRDENTTDSTGQDMYDLWNDFGKCPPEPMATVMIDLPDCNENLTADWCETIADGDFNADGNVDLADYAGMSDCLNGPGTAPDPTLTECAPACLAAFDADDDGDVDLDDFRQLQDQLR